MQNTFQELEQELHHEQRVDFLKRLMMPAAAAALLILIVTGIGLLWFGYQDRVSVTQNMALQEMVKQSNNGENVAAYGGASELSSPYNALALLNKASDLSQKSPEESQKALEEVIGLAHIDPYLKGAAQINLALLRFDKDAAPLLIERLTPLTDKTFVFYRTATELLGYAYLQGGNTEQAKAQFKQLFEDAGTPSDQKERIKRFL